jgi:hypothetical protein
MHATYDHASFAANRFVRVMTVINVAMVLAVIGLWSFLAPYVSEPLSAAMKMQLPTGDRLDLFDPIFSILWLPSLIAIILSNASLSTNYYRLARWIAAFPIVVFAMSLIWYHVFSATYG